MSEPTPPLVWIEWEDACSTDGWTHASDKVAQLRKVVTVGYVKEETDQVLSVAGSKTDDDFACIMHVPKSCITRRESMLPPLLVCIDQRAEDLRHG
jgi:hypothetical protein